MQRGCEALVEAGEGGMRETNFKLLYDIAMKEGHRPDVIYLTQSQYYHMLWRYRHALDREHPHILEVEEETEATFRKSLTRKEKGRITRLLKAGRLKIIYKKED